MGRKEQKDQVFLQIATLLGTLGTCDRARVGAVIVKGGRCVTWGYNGAPSGLPHCDENNHGWETSRLAGKQLLTPAGWVDIVQAGIYVPGMNVQDILMKAAEQWGCLNVTHAEANALTYAARQGISTEGGTLYVERSPCLSCARLLLGGGISRVVYSLEYRDPAGVDLLREAGIWPGRVELE